jgi:predicted permease
MTTALQNIFAMYCIMMGAYFLKKRSPYPVEVVNNLVFNFFLPVTIFYSIIEIQTFQPSAFIRLVVFSFGVLLVTCALTFFMIKPFHFSENVKRTFILGASYGNQAFLGFPVAYAFLGDMGVVLAIFYAIGGYFFLYIVGFYIMTGKVGPSGLLKNPLVISLTVGLLCLFLKLEVPQLLSYSFSLMNKATFPLSMVVVGGGLSLKFFLASKNIIRTLTVSFIKLIISPLIAYIFGLALSLPVDQLAICTLLSGMPAAVLVTIFSVKYDGDDVLSNSIVSVTTLASIGTVPLLSFLLKQM